MTDPFSMTVTAIGAAAALSTALKNAISTAKAKGESESIGTLLEVQTAALELVLRNHELVDRNHELEQQLVQLKEHNSVAEQLFLQYNMYWRKGGDGTLDGPYSRPHWQENQLLFTPSLSRFVPNDTQVMGVLLEDREYCASFFDDSGTGKGGNIHVPITFLIDNNWIRLHELDIASLPAGWRKE